METLILAAIVTLLAILGLAIGVIAGAAPLKGSCGGLACLKGVDCAACNAKHGKDTP